MTLNELYQIIEDRKKNMPAGSYVAFLFKQGNNRISQKVGEEATEVIIAAKGKSRRRIISEVADLLFHLLILLSFLKISMNDVLKELESRSPNKRSTRRAT